MITAPFLLAVISKMAVRVIFSGGAVDNYPPPIIFEIASNKNTRVGNVRQSPARGRKGLIAGYPEGGYVMNHYFSHPLDNKNICAKLTSRPAHGRI